MNGRALTPEQKRAVIEQLYASWLGMPEQRLAQLIINASDRSPAPMFYIEDDRLAVLVNDYVKDFGR